MMPTEYVTKGNAQLRRLSGPNGGKIDQSKILAEPNPLNSLLSESINETLTDLLGTRVREAIYDCMGRNHSIARDEIPENTDALFRLFEIHFGTTSKKVIGRMIAKRMYSKLNWEFQPGPKLEFNDYLVRIKTRLANEVLDRARSGQFS